MACIHFIGGEKGGVGKSVTARVLAQYHIDNGIPFRVFDSDASHGAMLRFYGDFSQALDIDTFESADQIVEIAAEQNVSVIVDLAAQTSRFLRAWILDNDLPTLAAEMNLKLVYWHVMDDGHDSLKLLDVLLADYAAAMHYVLVRNHGRGRDFSAFDASDARTRFEETGAVVIDLGGLHPPTMNKIDHFGSSFWAAANNRDPDLGPTLGIMERQRVKVWLGKAYSAIDTIACPADDDQEDTSP
ncbi:MAG: mobilization protein [Chromatiales bacterium]|nr:mobilization protein [Gammaproteobacteria bacterium]MCP5352463.1 mobilization protein [Chromatiales bacterium]